MNSVKVTSLRDLDSLKAKGTSLLYPAKIRISVEMATCGISTGAGEVLKAITEEIEKHPAKFVISQTGCIGFCQKEPLVDIWESGKPRVLYCEMSPEKAREVISARARGQVRKEWILCQIVEKDSPVIEGIPLYSEIDFFSKQRKIVTKNCGFINPDSIEEYVASGGYFSLYKVINEMKAEETIDVIIRSGLRGRGGAGFPTGLKWQATRSSKGDTKYIICNADEGDPGAYMDRSVLEGDPHSVLEGMIIGAYAIGANTGYIYVRDEYPLAVAKFTQAVHQAEQHGLLGENIFGTSFSFNVKVAKGAGAFVCGEETALIASIEGGWSGPKPRPPFPAQKGLFGKPTNINNVETWANVPAIIEKGADWFARVGVEKSKGTKVFSVVGKIKNTGLVEVPMGITLREIVYDIGGGVLDNREFKAVQTGGPSGGCIPSSLLDLKVDYERLTGAGAMMGSGGMIIMDDNTCMVDVARYFLGFLEDESCGKCVPCREGIEKMREVLSRICEGKGCDGDIKLLENIAVTVKETSMCGLGQTAPNPVLTTLKYFRGEFEKHIRDKKCPAGVCIDLISYSIDAEKCNGCGVCVAGCPTQAITGVIKKPHSLDKEKCIKCGVCHEVCKHDSILIG